MAASSLLEARQIGDDCLYALLLCRACPLLGYACSVTKTACWLSKLNSA